MKRKEQELLERTEGNESWKKEPTDKQPDGPEDEFDPEFWIKVSKPFCEFFLNNFWCVLLGWFWGLPFSKALWN